jgi:hypothetical protein
LRYETERTTACYIRFIESWRRLTHHLKKCPISSLLLPFVA